MGLSLVGLFFLPSQDASFTPVFNGIFGTWLCAAAGILASHIVYRRNASRKPEYSTLSEILFIIAAAVLLGTGVLEWHRYWSHQEIEDFLIDTRTLQAFLLAAAVFIAAVVSRPVCPAGLICRAAAVLVAVIGAITAIANLAMLYHSAFRFLLNGSFAGTGIRRRSHLHRRHTVSFQNRIEGLAPDGTRTSALPELLRSGLFSVNRSLSIGIVWTSMARD
jgi:UPF0716 family protein affecting phage T7 exclusion